jgi:hypothetical protein
MRRRRRWDSLSFRTEELLLDPVPDHRLAR